VRRILQQRQFHKIYGTGDLWTVLGVLGSMKLIFTTHKVACVIVLVMSVCMYYCQITFESVDVGSVVYLHSLQVEFVYEGHQVKIKVTGAKKKSKIPILAMY